MEEKAYNMQILEEFDIKPNDLHLMLMKMEKKNHMND